jgi:hypothetical protein
MQISIYKAVLYVYYNSLQAPTSAICLVQRVEHLVLSARRAHVPRDNRVKSPGPDAQYGYQ